MALRGEPERGASLSGVPVRIGVLVNVLRAYGFRWDLFLLRCVKFFALCLVGVEYTE